MTMGEAIKWLSDELLFLESPNVNKGSGRKKKIAICRMSIDALRKQEEQRWIPVTEKLPEDDLPKDSKVKQIKVLVAYKTNGRWVERTQIRVKGYWFREPDKWSWAKTSDPISHWMPLPEPPKEDA